MKVSGTIRVPGDKSISHRSLMLASLCEGESRVRGILEAGDIQSTAGVMRKLGAEIPELAGDITVRGKGLRGLRSPRSPLWCGNSGTTARLVAGIVAAHPFSARFEGDESLSRRPMKRIAEPLTYMGAQFEFERGDGLPMTVRGVDLRSIDWNTGGSSAQVKSSILLAGLVAGVEVRVTEENASRDHTERMLRSMGVDVENDGYQICLRPAKHLSPVDIEVPGDPSAAAYFMALGSLADEGELVLEEVCLNPTRGGFLASLRRMGADITEKDVRRRCGEDVGSLRVRPAALGSLAISDRDIPSLIDELPLLACVAAAAGVDLEVTGAAELRLKESDRISIVVRNLRAVGGRAEEMPDGFRIGAGRRPLSGRIDPAGDHRIAMAFAILGAVGGNQITVADEDCVGISYPGFWRDLERAVA